MRIVLDTNIFISALISGDGYPGQLLAAVKRERITLVTSIYQIDELRDVLGRERLKPYIRPAEAEDLVYHLEAVGIPPPPNDRLRAALEEHNRRIDSR